jgi:DNA-binding IclR family transcriptional regulator
VLDKVEGTGFLRAAPRIGSEVPVHATAVGKLYLAFAPEAVKTKGALPRFTPRTRTTHRALANDCARSRRRGWAENREEWQPGLTVVAAPVRIGERLEAALALAAPAVRLPAERTAAVARRLLAAAAEIDARLRGAT